MLIGCLRGRPVAVDDGTAYDLSDLLGEPRAAPGAGRMLQMAQDWPRLQVALAPGGLGDLPVVEGAPGGGWDPPMPRPPKVVGAALNYRAHAEEMRAGPTVESGGLFLKASSSVVGPGATVLLPFADRRTDQEAELGVVIGRTARGVAAADALDHVLGYTCLLDISLRGEGDRSIRKSFDTFTPLGPFVATPETVGDPGALHLRCWVGDELRQDAPTSELLRSVPELIAEISAAMTLEPGDVIATGTPAGVGPLAPGDRIVVEIERVGRLEVGVEAGYQR
ncbi:MAG TPA: fumarylacetoacetate hydrolase family protein [Acidimicrobiales bacterium]|nr:fumarylacetoacetate hydrolase family protein [Acidimicrobiales bacterium]